MTKHLKTALLYTVISAVLLGLVYPLILTGIARLVFRDKADGQLITRKGQLVGSKLIGQSFTGPGYFHSRPSAAGTGYDANGSSGSNLAPTSKALADRVAASVKDEQAANGTSVPIDLVTASGSGLDPDITPAAALYQVDRVAAARKLPSDRVRALVQQHIVNRQFGLLGEPRVNVLQLNLALEDLAAQPAS